MFGCTNDTMHQWAPQESRAAMRPDRGVFSARQVPFDVTCERMAVMDLQVDQMIIDSGASAANSKADEDTP